MCSGLMEGRDRQLLGASGVFARSKVASAVLKATLYCCCSS